ncbi:hypothetical protein SOVF_199460 [Spinacia oleracea]|nr:hypothetical protein SOVF_199460 [Spinacia oleracea]
MRRLRSVIPCPPADFTTNVFSVLPFKPRSQRTILPFTRLEDNAPLMQNSTLMPPAVSLYTRGS